MDWWLQPSEALAFLLGSMNIMRPICVAGCLIIMSLCFVIYTLRQSEPSPRPPPPPTPDATPPPEEADRISEQLDVDPEDTGSSFPLVPCVPLPQSAIDEQTRQLAQEAQEAEAAEAARAGWCLPRKDRVRIAKDVLPGFGIVMGIVFALLLFVVITTLHRADGHPIRCACACDHARDGGDVGGADTWPSVEKSGEEFDSKVCNSSCRCLCFTSPDSEPKQYPLSLCECGCVGEDNLRSDETKETCTHGMESINSTLEIKDDFGKHEYNARKVRQNMSNRNNGKSAQSLTFKNTEQPFIIRNILQRSPEVPKNEARFVHSNANSRQRREEPTDNQKPNDSKWEFFSAKNISIVVLIALISTAVILAVCHLLAEFHKSLCKVCASQEFMLHRSSIDYVRSTDSV